MAQATKITRTTTRRFLLNNSQFEGMRLADLQVYQDIGLAYAVMVSRNHLVYEVDLKWEDGNIKILSVDVLVKVNERPERFQFIGKEVR